MDKMKQIILLCLGIFVILTAGCSKHKPSDNTSNTPAGNFVVTKVEDQDRIVVWEKYVDLDNGKRERVVLDIDKKEVGVGPALYSRLLIYDKSGSKLLFNSVQAGVRDFAGVYFDEKQYDLFLKSGKNNKNWEYLRISDDNINGIPEIHLKEHPFASDPNRQIIIEKIDGKYQIIFDNYVNSFEYIDFDNDGVLELITCSGGGPADLFPNIRYVVYKFINNNYAPSYELTKQYIEIKSHSLSTDKMEDLTLMLTLYATLGLKDEGNEIIKKHMLILGTWGEGILESAVINKFEDICKSKHAWLEKIKTGVVNNRY